jgi:lipopolysaccharide export system protein LptA
VIQDERMRTEAGEIDVTLDPRRVQARQGVRTTLQPPAKETPGAKPAPGSRLPGVFNQEKGATVRAQALDYSGASGRTVYSGSAGNRAILMQEGTNNAISADRIELDQETGDLVAEGNASSRLALASDESFGDAREIRFENEKRVIRFTSAPAVPPAVPAPARGTARGAAPPPAAGGAARGTGVPAGAAPVVVGGGLARLSGGFDGDLRGETIVATLAAAENRIEQVEVRSKVAVTFDKERSATADRLVYDGAKEYYELTGTAAMPVTLVTRRPPSCRELSGRLLTYHRPTDSMLMDGKGETRASAATKPCAVTPAR